MGEPLTFASEHERWAEGAAVQCERNIDELLISARTYAKRILEDIQRRRLLLLIVE